MDCDICQAYDDDVRQALDDYYDKHQFVQEKVHEILDYLHNVHLIEHGWTAPPVRSTPTESPKLLETTAAPSTSTEQSSR